MGAPCKVTFEGKTFFKPDFIKRLLDTLQLEDDVVDNSPYLKSIKYDNSFNEGDPMLIREKKEEAKAEAKEQAKEETKKSEEKIFTYDKDGNIVEATVIAKGKNTTSVSIDGKQTTRANTELFNNKEDAQSRLSETEESKAPNVKEQIENFGVAKEDVNATEGLLSQVFDGLKKAGLTAAKNLGEWVGIGKGVVDKNALKQIIGQIGAENFSKAKDNLPIARNMELDGKSPKSIKIATGWERGADGKWRYEIPDNISYLKDTIKQIKEFLSQEGNIDNVGQKASYFLPPEIMKIYPELDDVTIVFNKKGDENEGSYSSTFKIITLNIGVYPKITASVLLHELQHAIQDIEGFDSGASPSKIISDFINKEKALLFRIKRLESPKGGNNQAAINKAKQDYRDFVNKFSVTKEGKRVLNALNLYERKSGEVEARNVQKRMDMTPEQRSQSLLSETEDVARESQIFVINGEPSIAASQPLFKDAQAQYRIESGRNIVEALKDFNGSPESVVALTHEIMHPTVVAIIDGANEGNEVGAKHTQTIVDEFNKANPNNKITVDELIAANEEFKAGKTSKKYRAVQEFIADSWEKYHTEGGKGFSKPFQDVLDQITKAFQSVYDSIKGKKLTPELSQMFDELLGKQPQVAETSIFDDFDSSRVGGAKAKQVAANKAFAEKYGEDAAVARAISTNFEAIADELKAKGIFTKIKC